MKTRIGRLLLALAIGGLAACGSGEDLETIECGEGTELDEQTDQCVAVQPQCADSEVMDLQLGRCVRAGEDYCAEGTELDPDVGQCVADASLECAPNTIEEDGHCVPELQVECGLGTVVHDERCVPAEEVCGPGSQATGDEQSCLPSSDVCGEGTAFDTADRVCIPASFIECGSGTVEQDGQCISKYEIYDELAEDPDIDLSAGDSGSFDLANTGEMVIFVGNIDPPQMDDGQPVQDKDVLSFDADAGQWLRITVFSLGLPEPGFFFASQNFDANADDFYRLSDRGAGIEVSREVVVPTSGTYELTISNLPQLLDMAPEAGGEDWGYVGYVETLETPEAQSIDVFEDEMSGDIRNLSNNFYAVDDLGGVENLLLIFNALPADADAELQLWTDSSSLADSIALDDISMTVEPPADSLYLLFDRVHAFGPSTGYSATAVQGQPLDDGDIYTEEIELEAGDYVGLFQFNQALVPVAASLSDGNTTLVDTASLEVSTAQEGRNSLYWYAASDTTVTVEVENTSGQDLASFSATLHTGSADPVDIEDTSVQEVGYDVAMSRGQRHYFDLDISTVEGLTFSIADTAGSGLLVLTDDGGNRVAEEVDHLNYAGGSGDFLLYMEARQGMGSGFTLVVQDLQIFEYNETSNPEIDIPHDTVGANDVINVDVCPSVSEISVDIDLSDQYPHELIISLTDPGGDTRVLLARDFNYLGTGGITGNFNETIDPVTGASAPVGVEAEPVDVFVGTAGSGGWTLNVLNDYFASFDPIGTLHSWGLNLVCE